MNTPAPTSPAPSQLDRIEARLEEMSRELVELRRVRQEFEDLKQDLTLVAKDAMLAACQELEGVACDVRPGEFVALLRNLLRNSEHFNRLLNLLESAMDFAHDATPLAREMFHDGVQALHELDQRGYFDFLPEFRYLLDNLVRCFKPEDLRALAEHLPDILRTVRNLTQPEMLRAVDNAALIFRSLDPTTVEEISIFRVIREINTLEMRRAIGLFITFLKRVSREQLSPVAKTDSGLDQN